jgi:hypothetical protein
VNGLAAEQPYVGSLSSIAAWRAGRRAVRARAIAPDGTVEAVALPDQRYRYVLEDATGSPRELVRAV